jgi:hypothetical protein
MAAYLDHLTTMGRMYSNNTELMDKFTAAQQANNTEVINALLPQVQLATAIGQVAAARGLDADLLAQYTTTLQQSGEYADATTESLVGAAAEMAEHQ